MPSGAWKWPAAAASKNRRLKRKAAMTNPPAPADGRTQAGKQARAAAAQRRVEYEAQIRAQQAVQRRAKRERQQRNGKPTQAAAQVAAQPAAKPQSLNPQRPLGRPSKNTLKISGYCKRPAASA